MLKNATNNTTPRIKIVPKLEKDNTLRNTILITLLWAAAICAAGYGIAIVVF